MMTRTAFKALWFGGGGVLATWLAVSPTPATPAAAPTNGVQSAASSREPTAEGLDAQAERLRERVKAVEFRPSTRNPFRFSSPRPSVPRSASLNPDVRAIALDSAVPSVPRAPRLTLSGVATTAGKRRAVITSEGQIYLVGKGDSFAGRYTVIEVESDAVLIRDGADTEQRLAFP
jgi:hypothetical protein